MTLDLVTVARALGGETDARGVLAPGPGHSPADRSLRVFLDENAPEGFRVESFAGDDFAACRDHVRARLALPAPAPKARTSPATAERVKPIAEYIYRDATGAPFLKVLKWPPRADGAKKTFAQSRWDGRAWQSGKPKTDPIPYRLPELLAAPVSETVFIAEGEKDADTLAKLGLIASTNPEGAGKWRACLSPHFAGRHVAILPDNDAPGAMHARAVRDALRGVAASVVVVELPGLGQGEDVTDWLSRGGTKDVLLRLVDEARARSDCAAHDPTFVDVGVLETSAQTPPKVAASQGDKPIAPEPISAEDFLALALPPRALLLTPWLPAKGLAMIAAPRGLGKTHLALNIAYAVASGGKFLRWDAPHARRVLYCDGEMPAAAMQERLARIATTRGALSPPKSHLQFILSDLSETGIPDLSLPDGIDAMRARFDPFDLIVLDNLSTLCRSGRENESESWTVIQGFLLELRRAGKSVLLIHHTGKAGQQRGTSKREDVLDSVLLLKRPEDYDPKQGARFTVTFDKARGFHGEDAEPFEAALDPHTGLWTCETVKDARNADIRDMKDAGMSHREIARELGIGVATVNRALNKAQGGARG